MSTPDLSVVRDAVPLKVRKTIYAAYVMLTVLAGASEVAFVSAIGHEPVALVGAVKVLTYLAAPVAALALVNATPTIAPTTTVNVLPADDVKVVARDERGRYVASKQAWVEPTQAN